MAQRLSEYLNSSPEGWSIEYRVHATQRMFKRCIEEEDLFQLLSNGTIIEEYKDDFPFPSVLINGVSDKNRPLHAVIGIDAGSNRLYLITIYEPNPEKWLGDYSKRVI